MSSILIRGRGVAAACCAHLLGRAGRSLTIEPGDRAQVPPILLGEAPQGLIRDVFGQPELFQALPRIERRIVAWGPDSEEVTLPHSAVVVSEQQLCDLLDPVGAGDEGGGSPSWSIVASRPLPAPSCDHAFGSRQATAVVRAAVDGADLDGVLEHYGARLLAGFRRHLETCESFYVSGGNGPWWAGELAAIREGLEWCDRMRAPGAGFRYRLDGFELRPLVTKGS